MEYNDVLFNDPGIVVFFNNRVSKTPSLHSCRIHERDESQSVLTLVTVPRDVRVDLLITSILVVPRP